VSEADWWQGAVFFERFEVGGERFHDRLERSWDCVLLFESTLGYQCLLIIKWQGDTAYRVGNLQIQDDLAIAFV
jgi:hypothetical protein